MCGVGVGCRGGPGTRIRDDDYWRWVEGADCDVVGSQLLLCVAVTKFAPEGWNLKFDLAGSIPLYI